MKMSLVSPSINGVLAQLLGALLIIAVGVLFKERLNRKFVYVNIIGLVLFAVTSELNLLDLPLLIFYVFLGILVAYFEVDKLYGLFGSIVYGSLLFAITFFQLSTFQDFFNSLLLDYKSANLFLEFYYGLIFVYWLLFTTFAFIIEWLLRRR
jgi:hypothetical protein